MTPEKELPQPIGYRNSRHEQRISGDLLRAFPDDRRAQQWALDAFADGVVAQRNPKVLQPGDWSDMQVARQVDAFGIKHFEVRVIQDRHMVHVPGLSHFETQNDSRKQLVFDAVTANEVIYQAAQLRRLNAGGADIHIRPKDEHGYSISLVDDVNEEKLKRMKAEGFAPALIVRTSPGNYQAWMRHGEALTRQEAGAAGKFLAERFGADLGGSTAGHMGRMAGMTNRKEQYEIGGKHPWVVVSEAPARVYSAAPEFISGIKYSVAREIQREQQRPAFAHAATGPMKSIEDFRRDTRYAGDLSRADYAFAMYATGKGMDRSEITAQIKTRDLSRKAVSYAEYTVDRATKRVSASMSVGMV